MSPTESAAEDATASADGEESLFDTRSGVDVSQRDRIVRWIEEWFLASARIAWSDWRVRVGAIIVLFYVLMGTVGVLIVPKPEFGAGGRFVKPFNPEYTTHPLGIPNISLGFWTYTGIWRFPFGTDNSGRDILAQIVHATPWMLQMILAGAVFSIAIATLVGTLSGYKRGTIDTVLMTLTDIAMTIPGLPLVIVLSVLLQPHNPMVIGVVITINAWAGLARSIRSQVLTIREESYIEASRTIGVPTHIIIREDILPNLMPYVVVNFVQAARNVIFASVGLYFLGILPTSKPNWGVMMHRAYTMAGSLMTLSTAYWLIIPMITIIVLVFGLILFAQGTDRLFNPRVRARHAEGPSPMGSNEETDTWSPDESKGMF